MDWDDLNHPDSGFSDFRLALTKSEKAELEGLDKLSEIVRDRVRGVVGLYNSGFYLWGSGGIGKSFIVQEEFKRLQQPIRLSNTRLTAKGLFNLLARYPNSVHLIEDCESLLNGKGESAKNAASICLSALWSLPGQPRLIKWITDKAELEIDFGGSLVLINNAPLDDVPTLAAARTRIAHLRFEPTNPQIAALAKSIALEGFQHHHKSMHAMQCLEVYKYVKDVCDSLGRDYDLRIMVNGFLDRLQWEEGDAASHWHDLVSSRLRERVSSKPMRTRAAMIKSDREIAREIDDMNLPFLEKIDLWNQRTGKSKTAFYARLQDLADEERT